MPVSVIYIVLCLGIVIGYCLDELRLMWRKALAERERERYFAAKVNRMPRRVG